MRAAPKPLIRFEDVRAKDDVFRLSAPRVAAAQRRNPLAARAVRVSCGHDLREMGAWLPRIHGLVCSADVLLNPAFPLRTLAQAAPRLRWIHTIGAGVEKLMPLGWLRPDLVLTNNSGVHVKKVYEFGLMSLLMLNARVPQLSSQQFRRQWSPVFTGSVQGRTLLVIGLGDMGGAIAKAGRTLGMRVLGIRRAARPHAHADEVHAVTALARLLPKADIVAIATPLTGETARLIGRREIGLLKQGAGLINVGRAAVLDQAALVAALRAGRLSGAILDVFDPEPLPASSRLWHVPNLMVSPHCSSDDADDYIPLTLDLALKNAHRLARGRPLLNAVDVARGY